MISHTIQDPISHILISTFICKLNCTINTVVSGGSDVMYDWSINGTNYTNQTSNEIEVLFNSTGQILIELTAHNLVSQLKVLKVIRIHSIEHLSGMEFHSGISKASASRQYLIHLPN